MPKLPVPTRTLAATVPALIVLPLLPDGVDRAAAAETTTAVDNTTPPMPAASPQTTTAVPAARAATAAPPPARAAAIKRAKRMKVLRIAYRTAVAGWHLWLYGPQHLLNDAERISSEIAEATDVVVEEAAAAFDDVCSIAEKLINEM